MCQRIKRLGIYSVYDADGIIDEYIFIFLQKFQQFTDRLYIVCNDAVREEYKIRLSQYAAQVCTYQYAGRPMEAYGTALETVGYAQLGAYDELVLADSDMYGPLFPLSEMFDAMDRQELDFWGVTSQHGSGCSGHEQKGLSAYLHQQFIAIRRRMLSADGFEKYWRDLRRVRPSGTSDQEAQFTRHFERLGFSWGTYTGTEQMDMLCPQPAVMAPVALVRDRRCPLINRNCFFSDYTELLANTNGTAARDLFTYIRDHLDYDADLIWENLLRTCNHAVLRRSLHLNYILPDRSTKVSNKPKFRTALWMHIYYEELISECVQYAASMPEDADIIVTTDTEQKRNRIKEAFSILNCGKLQVVMVENRGRDNSALLVGCAPFWGDYDIVCFAHDKKVGHLRYEAQGRSFSERCYQNTLISRQFVANVVQTFADNPRLGLLCPPPPNTSVYYNTVGISDWGPNYENTKALYGRLELRVPIDRGIEPVAPFGSVFWFRTRALERLFRYGWTYDDFPEEPVDYDGTLLHAIERIYPFVAQQDGFYSGWLLSDSFAAVELTNYHYMLRELNCRLHPVCSAGDFKELCGRTEKLVLPSWRMLYQPLKRWLKKHLPEKRFYSLVKLKKRIFREV